MIPENVDGMLNVPILANVNKLNVFLGILSYYDRFLDRPLILLKSLHKSIRKGQPWNEKDFSRKFLKNRSSN